MTVDRSVSGRREVWEGSCVMTTTSAAFCADGPVAGEEFSVVLDETGSPPEVVDVEGHTYLLAVQPQPLDARPWRYTVVRDGTLLLLDGGRS